MPFFEDGSRDGVSISFELTGQAVQQTMTRASIPWPQQDANPKSVQLLLTEAASRAQLASLGTSYMY